MTKVSVLATYDDSSGGSGSNGNNGKGNGRVRGNAVLGNAVASSIALTTKGACGLDNRCVMRRNTALRVRRNIGVVTICSSVTSCVLIGRNNGVGTMNAPSGPVMVADRGRRPNT